MTTVTPVATASAEARSELRDWLEGSRLVSFTTAGSDGLLRSRPLTLLEMDDDARLWFFVSITTPWVTELEPASPANATLIDSTDSYRELLTGQVAGRDVWKKLNAANRVGVTRGTFEERRNPLAIL